MSSKNEATEPRSDSRKESDERIVARKESDERIVAQLDRLLSSKVFRQADRLKRFLTFTINETVAGRGEQLKEFVIGAEVFDKGSGFDPRSDPVQSLGRMAKSERDTENEFGDD